LGRLARDAGFLISIGVLAAPAATAPAAPAPTLFRVTLTAVAHQEWDHTAAPVMIGSCERTERSEGIRTVTFRTKRPGVLRIADRRFLAGTLTAVTGTVSLVGANTDEEVCGQAGMELIADCAPTRRSFTGASLRISGRSRGVLVVTSVRNVRLRGVQCPREPADVRRAPLGPLPITFRVSPETLANPRIVRITLRASSSRTRAYPAPEAGTLKDRGVWLLTLRRIS
jgi:hypothetical protein